MQKTEAIIFDLGGVILNIDYHLTRTAFENLGIKNFDKMYSQSDADDLFCKLETGKITEDNFYKEINKHCGLHLSAKEIREAWNAMLLTFREKSLGFINTLQPKYKLFLLSNTNHIHLKEVTKIYFEKKRNKPFEKNFDKTYFSCEIGLRKPDEECYKIVLKENKLTADRTLFVDDSIQNIETAKALGIQTILLTPGNYIEDLAL